MTERFRPQEMFNFPQCNKGLDPNDPQTEPMDGPMYFEGDMSGPGVYMSGGYANQAANYLLWYLRNTKPMPEADTDTGLEAKRVLEDLKKVLLSNQFWNSLKEGPSGSEAA